MPRPSRPGHEFAIINCDPHPGVANSPQWILMPSLLLPSFSHAQLDSRGCWLRLPCVRGLKCGSNVISNGPRPIVSRLIRIITCATYKTVWKLFYVHHSFVIPLNLLPAPSLWMECLVTKFWFARKLLRSILSPFMDDTVSVMAHLPWEVAQKNGNNQLENTFPVSFFIKSRLDVLKHPSSSLSLKVSWLHLVFLASNLSPGVLCCVPQAGWGGFGGCRNVRAASVEIVSPH